MEGLTRLVVESMSRHGFDRPLDYRRLQWSRWFRCESPHSLLLVPSKPGVVALADEIVDFGTPSNGDKVHVGTAAPGRPAEQSSAALGTNVGVGTGTPARSAERSSAAPATGRAALNQRNSLPDATRRMLAVLCFYEAEDMAFVLDRMFAPAHPMRRRLVEAHCFVRFVVIEDGRQRTSICNALNQWITASGDKICGTTGDVTSSMELAPSPAVPAAQAIQIDSGSTANIHCPSPLPSGF